MARVIGRTGSWVWWALGCLCAMLFTRGALAQEAAAQPEYGVRISPPVKQPAATEEQQKAAEKLVEDYLGPVAAREPGAEQKTAINAALKELSATDFARREAGSAALVRIGPAALGALRAAARDSQDPEVVTRAGSAVAAIENAARAALVEEVRKNPGTRMVISRRQNEARTAQFKAMRESDEARKAGRDAEAAAKAEEVRTARAKSTALTALMAAAFPGLGLGDRVAPVYGIRVPAPVD